MPMVGAGIAHSLENLMHRLPSWRDLSARKRKAPDLASSPAALAHLIEGQIIPRLLVAHQDQMFAGDPAPAIGALEADAFAPLLLDHDAYALLQRIETLLARGVTVETILIDLLAPAARRLGEYWESDTCDFVDVTMGLWRLQELVHELAARMPSTAPHAAADRHALFAVMPGDQHSFGMTMVDEFFQTAGWNTTRFSKGTQDELVALARRNWFELVGLTISNADHLEHAPEVIAAIRRASRNSGVVVMAGGRILAERPELALLIGADGTAADARQAVARAEILLDTLAAAEPSRC